MRPGNLQKILLLLIIAIAAILRFFNLTLSDSFFFHPDERNMAISVTQFELPNRISQMPVCILSQFFMRNSSLEIINCNLHPHFFAYGQFPLYLSFFSGVAVNQFLSLNSNIFNFPTSNFQLLATHLSFPQAIFWLRFWSALSSTATIFVVFLITRQLFTPRLRSGQASNFALLTAAFAAFTPGLIQAAHFGTTESLLTFFFMVIVYLSLCLASQGPSLNRVQPCTVFAITMGLALATKLSSFPYVFPFAVSFLISTLKKIKQKEGLKGKFHCFIVSWSYSLLILVATTIVFLTFSPFTILSYHDFRGITNYELGVATGAIRVFYTRQFEETTPILFQMGTIFPYVLGPGIFVMGLAGLSWSLLSILASLTTWRSPQAVTLTKPDTLRGLADEENTSPRNVTEAGFLTFTKQHSLVVVVILLIAFFSYFIPNAFLYAKWVRFMTPLLPLFAIFAALSLLRPYEWLTTLFNICVLRFTIVFVTMLSLLPGIAFMAVYAREDVRITASRWIYENIPSSSQVLSETANVIDIPVALHNLQPTTYNLQPVSFDFYYLDENPEIPPKLIDELVKADYIFVPSRRLFANSLRRPEKYPLLARYYQLLFSGKLGFEKVAEFTSFPALIPGQRKAMNPYHIVSRNSGIISTLKAHLILLTYGYLPDETAEETWTVFDHPVVRIYRKTKPKVKQEYQELFGL